MSTYAKCHLLKGISLRNIGYNLINRADERGKKNLNLFIINTLTICMTCVSVHVYSYVCGHVRMCVLTENVRAGADSVKWDAGELCFINTNHCVYIRHKLRIGGLSTVFILAHTHISLHVCTFPAGVCGSVH